MEQPFPLAYFITFTTYGTRLHGDPRGSVDFQHNQVGEPGVEPNPMRHAARTRLLRHAPIMLDEDHRRSVLATIERVARIRGWHLVTVNVRTNHVHLVIQADRPPEVVMTSLKSWATRDLLTSGLVTRGTVVWTQHGSTRYLWDEHAIELAALYVRDGQGFDLPSSTRPIG